MRRSAAIAASSILLLACLLPARAGQVIDRIVATVNGNIILQSDWDDAVRYEAFTAGRALQQVTSQQRKAALDRLIDQELLREQMRASDFPHATAQDVDKRIADIRRQYPGADTPQAWQTALARYGLTEAGLRKRIALHLDLLRLVDVRLRPSVQIDSKSIESYYNQELLPQIRQSGAKELPLAEVTSRIKELLTQKKMNQLLTAWLQNLRAGSRIHSDAVVSGVGDSPQ
jgi:peptidyl-prolyl cis-trans isomerase SurA